MDAPWIDLLNSDWRDYRGSGRREDRLEDTRWLTAFFERFRLAPGRAPSDADVVLLKDLRTLLRTSAGRLARGEKLTSRQLIGLNACLASAPARRRVESRDAGYSLAVEPHGNGPRDLAGKVAWSFARMLAEEDPTRVRICGNKDCLWVFYDESRSRTRRWCAAAECGNLLKVRRFRLKKAREGAKRGGAA